MGQNQINSASKFICDPSVGVDKSPTAHASVKIHCAPVKCEVI